MKKIERLVNITELHGRENLTLLTELDPSGCHCLQEIAKSFSLEIWTDAGATKAVINLCDTTVEDIPDMSIFEQSFEVIEEFFRKRRYTCGGAATTAYHIFVRIVKNGESRT